MPRDSDTELRARQAVVELGRYFTSRDRLRQALGFGPGDWFQGATPSPRALRRIEAFLTVARELDPLSGDKLRTGRYLARQGHRSSLERRRAWVVAKGQEHFRLQRADYVPPRSEWLRTLTDRHPELAELPLGPKDRRELGAEALTERLAGLVAGAGD